MGIGVMKFTLFLINIDLTDSLYPGTTRITVKLTRIYMKKTNYNIQLCATRCDFSKRFTRSSREKTNRGGVIKLFAKFAIGIVLNYSLGLH